MPKQSLASIAKSVRTAMKKHSPEILTGIGIAGMITTAVMAVKATPKALILLEEKKDELDTDRLEPKDIIKTAWPCYIPAAVVGSISVFCLIGASSTNLRRNAALATAYDLVKATSSPTGRVTYPSDVDNAAFTPAAMNFSTGKFNYGGWAFDPGEKFMPRPCMLTYAGVVDHYLNPNDYTKKVNGTTSKVTDTSFGGNAMMEWPKIYTKRWESNGVYHFRCSDIPQDDTWDCWCNYDRNNNQIDHFYTPIYFGSLVSGKLRSISGAANSVNTTAANEIAYAKANGNDWYTEVLADRLLLQDLLVMMARSTECQTAFGYGRCNSSNSIAPGTMNSKGMFWGSNDKTSGVKVFGMENVWGNLWRRTAGWINANGTQKVKLTRGTHDGSTATDYNTDGNGYKTIANATPAGSSGGYISSMKTEAFGRLPVNASGSSSTYEADGMWYNNSQVNYAFVGGYWAVDLLVGPFCASLHFAASTSYSIVGAALSCKPLAAA